MNPTNKLILGISLLLLLVLSSCRSAKQVAYFQYSSTEGSIAASSASHSARIKPKDLLSITVVSSNPEASRPYNLIMPQISTQTSNLLYSQPTVQSYLVEDDGSIDFPVLGRLEVVGMTRQELETDLLQRLASGFSEEMPIVTVLISNFSVHVLGEVARPGKVAVTNDRITILEALSQAGDLTLYGKRNGIKVLREQEDGTKQFYEVNLNDKSLIASPVFYLEQNDVVYVEPNDVRKRSAGIGTAETLSISIVGTLISVASLVVNILN